MKIPQDADTVSQVAQIIIDRITAEKDAEIERLRILLDNAWKALKTARQDALEEAAKWHDGEIAKIELQIQHNKDYSNRIGESENSIANEFCGHAISAHRTAAYQFRALKNKSAS